MTFRVDESEYTGFDLLNAEQRFQGASAVAIGDDDAGRLIKEHFPKSQASELKFRVLSRRVANHPRLLGLLRGLHTQFECVKYVCDKRYLLALMFEKKREHRVIDGTVRLSTESTERGFQADLIRSSSRRQTAHSHLCSRMGPGTNRPKHGLLSAMAANGRC